MAKYINNPDGSDSDLKQFLSPDKSAPIFEQAARTSVVQSLVPSTPLGINGKDIPVVTGKMSAGWVAEGGRKPKSDAGLDVKNITPHKIAAIAVVSAEVVRANPGGYMDLIRPQIAEAFALAFDRAALYGEGPFQTHLSQGSKSVNLHGADGPDTYDAVVGALQALVRDGKKLNGFALDSVTEPEFLATKDGNDRPIYIETPLTETTAAAARPGRLINRPSYMTDGVAYGPLSAGETGVTVGFAGDWTQAVWGVVGGITYDVSTQASVTLGNNEYPTSLWEHNLVAIRAEAEYGFLVNDPEAFVKLQLDGPAAGGGDA